MRRVEAREYIEMVIGLGGEINEERVEHLKMAMLVSISMNKSKNTSWRPIYLCR
jgi:hypothetical protein